MILSFFTAPSYPGRASLARLSCPVRRPNEIPCSAVATRTGPRFNPRKARLSPSNLRRVRFVPPFLHRKFDRLSDFAQISARPSQARTGPRWIPPAVAGVGIGAISRPDSILPGLPRSLIFGRLGSGPALLRYHPLPFPLGGTSQPECRYSVRRPLPLRSRRSER